ncbi:hypothetical protein NQ317_011547 [Molorchus minor]|uniref:Uncharacterized protein n=1 Tax=Molorchus minor TaxID=1323400 RepID=A0ABQ9K7I7_9CUCU|nr:hypothetical protein NQ317_011547 [Molorchus minor]
MHVEHAVLLSGILGRDPSNNVTVFVPDMAYIAALQLFIALTTVRSHPQVFNPYDSFFRYNLPYYNPYGSYSHGIPTYPQYLPSYINDLVHDRVTTSYLATPDVLPNLNILAEVPYSVSTKFTVVPMLLMTQENIKLITQAQIMSVSTTKPVMTVKTKDDNFVQCTPAVRIVLEKPIVIYSLKTSIVFPKEIQIVYERYKIPIEVGAVIAPVLQNTFISAETPVAIRVVYALPTKPITLDYVNNEDAVFVPETDAVVVEDQEAEPVLEVDEEDEELDNRNPPVILAPQV